MEVQLIFSLPGRSPGRAFVLPPASALVAVLAKSLMLKFFYVMGKALSGELSCTYDRSCLSLVQFLIFHIPLISHIWLAPFNYFYHVSCLE